MMVFRKIPVVLLVVLLFGELHAQDNFYKFHALFIYNFTKHVQWTGLGDAFTIGVYGSDIAMKVLNENLQGRQVSGHAIQIKKVSGPSDIAGCQILYAPKSNRSNIATIVEATAGRGILTVTEDDMISVGAGISFVVVGTRLNFKISRNNIEGQGLKVSSALLSLGELVE